MLQSEPVREFTDRNRRRTLRDAMVEDVGEEAVAAAAAAAEDTPAAALCAVLLRSNGYSWLAAVRLLTGLVARLQANLHRRRAEEAVDGEGDAGVADPEHEHNVAEVRNDAEARMDELAELAEHAGVV